MKNREPNPGECARSTNPPAQTMQAPKPCKLPAMCDNSNDGDGDGIDGQLAMGSERRRGSEGGCLLGSAMFAIVEAPACGPIAPEVGRSAAPAPAPPTAKHKVQRNSRWVLTMLEKLGSREKAANSKTKSRRKTQGREIHEKQLDAKDCRTKSRDESDDVGWVKERRIDGGGRVGRYGQNAWVSVAQRSRLGPGSTGRGGEGP